MTFHTPLFLATRSKTTKEKGGRGGKILNVHLHVCHTCYVHACPPLSLIWGFSGGSVVKRIYLPMQETWVQSLHQEDALEEEMATHSSILAREIPRTEEPGGLQSMGLQRVRHD